MEYRRFENSYVVRLNKGEEVISSLKKLCKDENIRLGEITGLGASDLIELTVGWDKQCRSGISDRPGGTIHCQSRCKRSADLRNDSGRQHYNQQRTRCTDRVFSCAGQQIDDCQNDGRCTQVRNSAV